MKRLMLSTLLITPVFATEIEDIVIEGKELQKDKNDIKLEENVKENNNYEEDIKPVKKTTEKKLTFKDNELLKLLVQTFLGNQDLENAYEVAKKAAELYPNDPYWLKMLGQIAIWNKKPEEGLQAYLKLFQLTKDESVKKDLVNLAIAVNRFDIAKQLIEEDIKSGKYRDFKNIYYIYYNAGDIKELISILKELYNKEKDKEILYNLVFLLYNYGDVKDALQYGKILIENHSPNLRDVLLYSNILYSNRRFQESYKVLKSFLDKISGGDDENLKVEYLETLSNLAWALKDFDTSVYASTKLYQMNKASLQDFIRLYTYYFYKQNYKLSQKFAYEGYEKYKAQILLEGYIESLFRLKDYKKIVDFVEKEKIQPSQSILVFSRYINSLLKIGEKEKVLNLVSTVLDKNFSPTILSELIYTAIDTSDQNLAKYLVRKYSKYENYLRKEFGFLYLFLQNGKKALHLLSNLRESKNLSELVLFADVLNLYGKFEQSLYLKYKIYKYLHKKINSGNYTDEELENYLKVAMEFTNSRKFNEMLEIAKAKLHPDVYQDIYLSYQFMLENQNKVEFLMRKHRYSLRPWMKLNLALWMDDSYWQQKLLEDYIDVLPIRDRVEALRRTGEVKKATEYSYKGLEENPDDYLLYKQQRDLIVENVSKFESKVSYTERGNVDAFEEDIYLDKYITENVKVFIKYSNSDIQKLASGLINTSGRKDFSIGLQKTFDNGKLTISIGVLDTVNSNPYIDIDYTQYIYNRLNLGSRVGFNLPADDTLYLLYGGMKNRFGLSLTYNFNNRLSYFINPSYNQYYSSDKVKIGTSFNIYEELYYKLRVGYPDYTFRLYTSHGIYNEKDGYKGSIEKISLYPNPKVLPSTYNQIGVGFLFGYENDNSYVRVFRPFLSVDLSYNDVTGVGYGFGGGFGGTIFRQDNLSVGFNYFKGFKGTTDKYFNTYIKYRLYY
ncbi:MAG: tetratricopeptide repeat protein [Sulfurihydrogenibium azorense]|uniref:tetratricopeptide repeat protein n=1 Tax=Sulfurihydrogenibium azorense TaxID=309806 RepID=UPI0039187983